MKADRTYIIPLGASVCRKTGEITLHTREGTREEFIQSIRPFLEMGRYLRGKETCGALPTGKKA